jgi:hypothetical protein
MNKTLILAATLLTLGAGSAFAGDGDVYGPPAQVRNAAPYAQANGQNRVFPAGNHAQTNVYGMFPDGSGGLRGNQ